MKKKIMWFICSVLFFFFLLTFVFTLSRGDTFVNYGFSYAIKMGQIPYKDFNMVITPLAPIFYSIGLFLFNDILFYYFEQAILLTILFWYLYRLLGKKCILFLLLLLIPYPIAMVSTIFPGYNFLIFFLFLLFIYYFKNYKNDFILGILLGLIFCTKQTVGIVLFLPTFYYLFSQKKKFFKMVEGFLLPIVLLLFYLLLTGSLNDFINLCFLGLFDFQNHNTQIDYFYFFLFLGGIGINLWHLWHHKNDLLYYYGIFFGVVVFPIIDYYHVSLFLLVPFFFLVDSISYKDYYSKYIFVFILFLCGLWSFVSYSFLENPVVSNYPHFSFVINRKNYDKDVKNLIKATDSLDSQVIYFMRGSENYFYKILHDDYLNYFDLPNYGNYGYNGIAKMKKKIDTMRDVYFVLDLSLLKQKNPYQQYIKELGSYVVEQSSFVKKIGYYVIYYKE